MARYQLFSSLLLLAVLAVTCAAQTPVRRTLRLRPVAFARQEVAPTPYPSAAELKPAAEQPALTYGPPEDVDTDALPSEQEPPVDSFEPNPETEEVDTEESSLEATTPSSAPARLRIRQRLAKLQLAKPKRLRQRIARLEELPVDEAVAPVVPAPQAPVLTTPQFYYVGAGQQPYYLAYNAAPQQLGW
ncbi:fibrous sheath CABYR-binding protein [Drosophila takahashii]|uniref:fibrous sheath CABYR-binding protein n=1 Tax=Drosophila takahashii TaxID=29030 RepID=UPI001CF81E1A|nr:fibrous sheath CABYR-binding protein [Drosophila takahashii]